MSQINGGKLYIVYLNLNPHDIANLKLNDKIYLDRSYWNINKVIDYDANSNEPTKVELLSIDDELVLPKIRRKIDAKPNNSSSLIKPFISDVLGEINNSLTINASTGNIVLNGKGNIIDSVVSNAVVIGDNQVVTKNGTTSTNSIIATTDGDIPAIDVSNFQDTKIALNVSNGQLMITTILTYADEAAATTAGLLTGTLYGTPTGEVRIKL
jgi:hypothetical protein